jgi:four helix bundle protein
MLYIANELHYLNKKEYHDLDKISNEISKMISGLIKTLK